VADPLGTRRYNDCQRGEDVSNVLRNNFFTVPHELVDAGHLAALSGGAVKLYIALMRLAQKHSAVEIEIPAYVAHDLADIVANTVTSASKELVAAGLVKSRTGQYGRKSYVLLDPKTGFPLPPPTGHRGIFRHPTIPGRSGWIVEKRVSTTSSETLVPRWEDIGKTGAAPPKRDGINRSSPRNAESQESRATIPKITSHDRKNCGPRALEALEDKPVTSSPSSLKTSLKRGVSEEGELTLPSCRNCGGYALYRDRSGRTICQTCEAVQ